MEYTRQVLVRKNGDGEWYVWKVNGKEIAVKPCRYEETVIGDGSLIMPARVMVLGAPTSFVVPVTREG